MSKKKRERWRLPKVFKLAKRKKGFRLRQDGEPVFLELSKHANDRSLTTHQQSKCCDCGLVHLLTYNVLRAPDGKWYLSIRAYRLEKK